MWRLEYKDPEGHRDYTDFNFREDAITITKLAANKYTYSLYELPRSEVWELAKAKYRKFMRYRDLGLKIEAARYLDHDVKPYLKGMDKN